MKAKKKPPASGSFLFFEKENKWKIIGLDKRRKNFLLTTGERNKGGSSIKESLEGLSFLGHQHRFKLCQSWTRVSWNKEKTCGDVTLWPRSTTSSSSEASEQKSSLSPPLELRLDVLLTFLLYNWLANALEPAANPTPLLPGLGNKNKPLNFN